MIYEYSDKIIIICPSTAGDEDHAPDEAGIGAKIRRDSLEMGLSKKTLES